MVHRRGSMLGTEVESSSASRLAWYLERSRQLRRHRLSGLRLRWGMISLARLGSTEFGHCVPRCMFRY